MQHGIDNNQTIFLFNGALDYQPNYDAVKNILKKNKSILTEIRP